MSFAKILSLRSFSTTPFKAGVIKNVTVIGGGLMGSGVAQVAAIKGHDVVLVDISDQVLESSRLRIEKSVSRMLKKKFSADKETEARQVKTEIMDKIKLDTSMVSAVKNADLVLEAVVENMDLKHKIFRELDAIAPKETIFATNTSSFRIQDVASVVERKDRFGGVHFFNPVAVMRLVEIIKTDETSPEVHESLLNFGRAMGKTTVLAKDTPGFIVNRLLLPFLMEALRMYERGDASMEDIDTAMKLGLGHPMGPFELLDYTGLDTCKFIIDGWKKNDPTNVLFKESSLLTKLVAEGKTGVKSGQGVYKYDSKK